jgi:hypothetical protein
MMRFLYLMAAMLLLPSVANAQKLCVYDPAGKTGDYFKMLEGFATEASGWGVDVELAVYTAEETAAKDYEAGHCQGVVATGVRLQRFNRFPSTIEAMGAVPSYDILKQMTHTLAVSDGAAKKLVSEDHETVGFIPVGAAYLFVRDRNIDTVGELAGKRIATMDYDKAAPTMVDRVGAIMVPADLGSIGPKFNNGDVDACYMSAAGYRPFELFRGLEDGGGILTAPLASATLQVLVKRSAFPEGFGKKSRLYFSSRFDKNLELVKAQEADIDDKYWVKIDGSTVEEWDEMFQGVRIKLKGEGAYDGAMLSVLRQLRCKKDSGRAECAEQKE